MIVILGATAVGLLAAIVGLMRRRRAHEPRAITLVLAVPPAPPTFAQAVSCGRAMIRGSCTWCGGPWEACANECAKRPPRPAPTSMPGLGRRRLG